MEAPLTHGGHAPWGSLQARTPPGPPASGWLSPWDLQLDGMVPCVGAVSAARRAGALSAQIRGDRARLWRREGGAGCCWCPEVYFFPRALSPCLHPAFLTADLGGPHVGGLVGRQCGGQALLVLASRGLVPALEAAPVALPPGWGWGSWSMYSSPLVEGCSGFEFSV